MEIYDYTIYIGPHLIKLIIPISKDEMEVNNVGQNSSQGEKTIDSIGITLIAIYSGYAFIDGGLMF